MEIEDDAFGGTLVGGDIDVEEDLFHRRINHADLVIAAHSALQAMLQPIERRLAGQSGDVGPLRLERVGQQAENGIVSQLVVVVDVLVAKRNSMHALRHQRLDFVHHEFAARPSRKQRATLATTR